MSQVAGARHTCENCGKTFVPKPEWYGRNVKCRCGYIMKIPVPPEPKQEPVAADDMYDLAPEGPAAKAKQHAAPPEIIAAATAKVVLPAGGAVAVASPVLGYRTPAARKEEDRFSSSSSTMMDPKRDLYVPVGLLIGGLLIYVLYYAVAYHMSAGGIALAAMGLSVMTAFKAVLLIIFAMIIAGPLGVSFGGIWTAALKLAAIAVFSDGATTWVDALVGKYAGGHGAFDGIISFPVALGIYWGLLIYLFNMDPGDSWMVVIILSIFDGLVRWIMIAVLLSVVMNMGGASGFGGGGSSSSISGGTSGNAVTDQDTEMKEAKEDGSMVECVAWSKEHSSLMGNWTTAFYNAGAKGCYFEISRDFNQKPTIVGYVVELPNEKDKRDKVLQVYHDYFKERTGGQSTYTPPPPRGNWIQISVNTGF